MNIQNIYNPVTPAIADELKNIVGQQHVIYDDADRLQPYSHDELPDDSYARMPEAMVRPGSTDEIVAIMKLANREMIPVTPRGAGSGLSGGAVPVHGGIVMLIDRMNRVLEVDRRNLMIVLEPGVVTSEINELLEADGLFYPGYPMSMETCFIAGNVAENAGGGKAVKYGVTGRYVIGLEVVTPTGDVLELGGKRVKDVTGYDLVQLMVGSEGTLGVITKIILKLMPAPTVCVDLLCLYETIDEAIDAVSKIMTESGIVPAAIEYMDQNAVRAACEYLNESIPYQDAGAMLIISVDGSDADVVERDYDAIGEMALQSGAFEVYVADNSTTSERIWNVRRNIAEAFNLISRHQSNEDIVVPPSEIAVLVRALQKLSKKYDVPIPSYGHAGDGNVHARVTMNPEWPIGKWDKTLPKVLTELYALTKELGGVLSGEHGIGHKRKKYMSLFLSEPHLELLRKIKRAFDPNNILNPGKVFEM